MASEHSVSPQAEYIQHHLVHLNNLGEKQPVIADFHVVNYDSLFWSIFMGLLVVFLLWLAARRSSVGRASIYGIRALGYYDFRYKHDDAEIDY